jgi:hypothetical protein
MKEVWLQYNCSIFIGIVVNTQDIESDVMLHAISAVKPVLKQTSYSVFPWSTEKVAN